MKERPIIYSSPMVRAVLAGLKRQTRRIIKPQPSPEAKAAGVIHSGTDSNGLWAWLDHPDPMEAGFTKDKSFRCPYGVPGDELWVRESWRVSKRWDTTRPIDLTARQMTVMFAAGGSIANQESGRWEPDDSYPSELPQWAGKLRPAIFMPRWASRLTLLVTEVRVQRLQSISEDDAIAEGVVKVGGRWEVPGICATPVNARDAFRALWNYVNGRGAWEADPWVWAVSFEKIADSERAAA